MSRIANSPVVIPAGIEATISSDAAVVLKIKGKLGVLEQVISPLVSVKEEEGKLIFGYNDQDGSRAMAGTMRALAANMVKGVSEGFTKELVMIGVGYRAQAQGNILDISAGFSHPMKLTMPEGVSVEMKTPTEIVLKSIDKQKLGQTAANIRKVRPPEPYKGKGIRYKGEVVILKEGKKK